MAARSLYARLQGSNAIRLLTLHPGNFGSPITVSLEVFSLDALREPFEALSYVWGDASVTKSIIVNHQSLEVTSNLHLALQYLRNQDRPRSLFVDACCINQTDIDEKQQQLLLMRRIYKEASKVLIWTGTEDEEYAKGLLELHTQVTSFVLRSGPDFNASSNIPLRERIRHTFLSDEASKVNWGKTLSFLKNEWFARTWTFQEAFVSTDADITCGRTAVPLAGLILLFMWLESMGIREWSASHSAARVFIATYGWARFPRLEQQEEPQLLLSTLLAAMFHHRATDPRDKIYGILPMLSEDQERLYAPNYSESTEETYTRVAATMMKTERHLSPLSNTNTIERGPGLPSWVADWRYAPAVSVLAERVRSFPPRYNASRGMQPIEPLVELIDGTQLQLQGGELDTVEWTTSLSDYEELGGYSDQWRGVFKRYKEYYEQLRMIHAFIKRRDLPTKYMDTDEPHFSAFIHALAADTLPRSTRRDPEDRMTLFLAHHELQGKTWSELLDPWLTSDEDRQVLAAWPEDPITSIYSLLLDHGPVATDHAHIAPNHHPPNITLPGFSLASIRNNLVLKNLATEIITSITRTVRNRNQIITGQGRLALGPAGTKVGDKIAAFGGGDVLYVIRRVSTNDHNATADTSAPPTTQTPERWSLVGEAYVHGLMDGEAWLLDDGLASRRTVLI
jgi:hypothetical protein